MILEIVFGVSVLLFVILSIVLEHHWRRYANASKVLIVARIFYYGVSALFILVILAQLFSDSIGPQLI